VAHFGRIRVAHLNAMIYGWASLAMLGVSLWMIPRQRVPASASPGK
jgi:cbb3-type cytochrome oxidase subunit 1